MGQEKTVGSSIVSDLEVAGLNGSLFCELPEVFTERRMPVNKNSIP